MALDLELFWNRVQSKTIFSHLNFPRFLFVFSVLKLLNFYSFFVLLCFIMSVEHITVSYLFIFWLWKNRFVSLVSIFILLSFKHFSLKDRSNRNRFTNLLKIHAWIDLKMFLLKKYIWKNIKTYFHISKIFNFQFNGLLNFDFNFVLFLKKILNIWIMKILFYFCIF